NPVRIRDHTGGDLGWRPVGPATGTRRSGGGLPGRAPPAAARRLAALHHHPGKFAARRSDTAGPRPPPRAPRPRAVAAALARPSWPPRSGRPTGAAGLRLEITRPQ